MPIPEKMPEALADIIRLHGGDWMTWNHSLGKWIAGNGLYMFTASLHDDNEIGRVATIVMDTEKWVHQFPFDLPPPGHSNPSWETIYSELEGAMRRPSPSTKESLLAIAGQCKPSNTTYVKELIIQLANSLDN